MEKTETKENENPLNINALQISTHYGLWKTSGKGMERQGISGGLRRDPGTSCLDERNLVVLVDTDELEAQPVGT